MTGIQDGTERSSPTATPPAPTNKDQTGPGGNTGPVKQTTATSVIEVGGENSRPGAPTTTPTKPTGSGGAAPVSTINGQPRSSILNATADSAPSVTTLVYGGQTEVFVKATLSDLTDLSTTRAVRTSVKTHDSGWITAVAMVVLLGEYGGMEA